MLNTLKYLTLITLAVIYIPIIIIIVKKWKAKATRFFLLPLAIVLFPILYLVILFNIPYYELTPFEGRVIDADTKEPIQGAAVLAVYYDQAITIAGTNTYPIDAREALTDEKGEFKIPEVKEWFGERLGTVVEAKLNIFRPGYGAFPRHKESRTIAADKGSVTSGKKMIYELPKLKTKEERARTVFDLKIRYDLPFDRQKGMIGKLNEEFRELGMKDRYIEKNGEPFLTLIR